MDAEFEGLIRALCDAGVEFILVGGLAATTHGSARATYDIDLVYARDPANLGRIVEALAPLEPYLRGAPPGLPFQFDTATLQRGLNFTLTTTLGPIDLLGEIAGGGTYESLFGDSSEITLFDRTVRRLDLPRLIEVKRAAGRPRDLEAVAELEALLEEQQRD